MLLYFFHKSNNFFICRGHARGKSIRVRDERKKNKKKRKMMQQNQTLHKSLFTDTIFTPPRISINAVIVIYHTLTESRVNDEILVGYYIRDPDIRIG